MLVGGLSLLFLGNSSGATALYLAFLAFIFR